MDTSYLVLGNSYWVIFLSKELYEMYIETLRTKDNAIGKHKVRGLLLPLYLLAPGNVVVEEKLGDTVTQHFLTDLWQFQEQIIVFGVLNWWCVKL